MNIIQKNKEKINGVLETFDRIELLIEWLLMVIFYNYVITVNFYII